MRGAHGAPSFEEFERARQEAVESLGLTLRQLERDPNGLHGEWLLDSLMMIERAGRDSRAFRDVAVEVIGGAVPRGPQAMPAGDL